MTDSRDERLAPRWSSGHRVMATLLLSILPVQTLSAATAPLAAVQAEPGLARAATPQADVTLRELPLFGPKKYVRTTGAKDVYEESLVVPAWLRAPFRLQVQNGEPDGTRRVSSGTIEVNGATVLSEPDLNQNVATIDRTVALTPKSELRVTLASVPRSYLTIGIFGTSADYTPPSLTWSQPASGSTINTATPRLLVQYGDTVGHEEPAESGVDLASLRVFVDEVDRTTLFTRRSDEASATIPDALALAEGVHTFRAEVYDLARNRKEIKGEFRVDLTPPLIGIASPVAGAYLPSTQPPLAVRYHDEVALDPASFSVTVNGVDLTSHFTRNPADAAIVWPAGVTLLEGPNTMVATIRDAGGNVATQSVQFNVDVTRPLLTIAQPPAGSRLGSRDVPLLLTWTDEQGAVASTATAAVDNLPVSVTTEGDTATGTMTSLADGGHTVVASVADRAGNVAQASSSFIVDTTVPVITVVKPPAGANIGTNTPEVALTYADNDGVDTSTLKVEINDVDRTMLFAQSNASAAAKIEGFTLPEGVNRVAAEIRDLTANLGRAVSSFFVDTILPTGAIELPGDTTRSSTPAVTVRYADSGSGIDPSSVRLLVDGQLLAGVLSAGPDSANATLPALTDGSHAITVTFADRAGNTTTVTRSTFVDTKAPELVIAAPADNSFTNTTKPAFRVTYQDPLGTGIVVGSLKVVLQKGSDPETDVTSYLTATSIEATGIVPDDRPLADGTYELRATILDVAGNTSVATASFEVDTKAPQYVIENPPVKGFVDESLPQFTIEWSDELSGINVSRTRIRIDGFDRTERFKMTTAGAVGTLVAEEALADGLHEIEIHLYDRAGNAAPIGPHSFTVDTIAPTVAVEAPSAGSYVGRTPYSSAVTYDDGTGSGVDPASVRVMIDGTDYSARFTAGPNRATAELTEAIADGPHTMTVTVLDWAANAATTQSAFVIDATAPAISISEPVADAWLKGPAITVKGTSADASPLLIEVNGIVVATSGGAFTATVPTADGPFVIRAAARDAAGNESAAEVAVRVDSAPPVITVTEPVEGLVTKLSEIVLAGSVTDVSPVTLTVDGQPLALAPSAFTTPVLLTADGDRALVLVATDAAGNSSTVTRTVTRDTIAPAITIASPAAGSVVGTLPLVVRGTAQDATSVAISVNGSAATITEGAWEISIASPGEGEQTLTVLAIDAAGNTATETQKVTIDSAAPLLTILTPAAGSLTRLETTAITGTATDLTLRSVTAGGIAAVLSAGSTADEKTFSIAAVPLVDGDNTLRVVATDALSRTTEATVLITRDSIGPLLEVDAPSMITRSRGARVAATASDNLKLRDVVFSLGTTVIATKTAAPYEVDVAVPETAKPGDELTLKVVATDTAGNTTTVTKLMRVAAEGAVVGQVLSDPTGLPVAGARVRADGTPDETVTDERGRYALPANDQHLVLVIEGGETPATTVERNVTVLSGVGTVPVDARLTPLGAAQAIGPNGGSLTSGGITVAVPSGIVGAPAAMSLTPLTGQGLPNLLPLGWSPVAAFDFRIASELTATTPFDVTVNAAPAIVHVAAYRPSLHAWVMLATNLSAAGGTARFTIPSPGSYALLVADDPSLTGVALDEPLTGLDMVPIPVQATSSGTVTPPTLPPTGGEATGRLLIHSPTALPSGTVVQAEVSESFSLSSGDVASSEKRTQDIVLYRTGSDLAAEFPIVPSRSFASGDLTEGKVHLDILAGREAVRGKTGGQLPLTLPAGAVTVSIPAGALPRDLAIAAKPMVLSSFLPATAAARPLAEVLLDFGGVVLSTPAELSVSAENVTASETIVVARVERINGVPHVMVVAATELVGDRFVSRPLGTLDGLRRDGRYVFYRVGVPWGLVTGSATFGSSGEVAVVRSDVLPFVALTRNGMFELVAAAGNARVTAFVPGTSLTGESTVLVTAGGTAGVTLGLAPTATTAVVTPADGALRIPVSAQVEILASAPISAASVNWSTVTLADVAGSQVSTRFVLSGSGKLLAVVPLAGLQPGQQYTLTVNGLRDIYGGAITLPPVRFTTAPDAPPSYDTNRITFTSPDGDGMVTVSAPPGSLPPGTRILIVNAGNAVVVSYTVGNDGSFSGVFPASIRDRLLITITDPSGNVVNFERSKFVFNDGTGRVAIGAGGGEVEGSGGTALRIPPGALPEGAVFKVDYFGPETFTERPTAFPEANFGGGLTITSEQMPEYQEEAKLVFPKPVDAPEGAFYYVFRRLTGPGGRVFFETVDEAFPEGDKIVTASPPYPGINDSVASWDMAATGIGFGLGSMTNFYLMWSFDSGLPGLPLPGFVVGKAYQVRYEDGEPDPIYEAVQDAMVSAVDATGMSLWDQPKEYHATVARTQKDGTFALWDPRYTGGPVQVEATYKGHKVVATGYQANALDTGTFFTNVFARFRNVADVSITFPADNTPSSPEVEVHVMRLTQKVERVDVNGVAVAGTPLLIGFKFRTDIHAAILSATVGIDELPVKPDDGSVGTGMPMDYIVVNPWLPNNAGTYTVQATILNPLGGPPLKVEHTFIVVAGSGTNGAPIQGAAPDWITSRLVPKPNSLGVMLAALPQVVFTEPVVNVVAGTQLLRDDEPVAFAISGAAVGSDGLPYAIADLRTAPPNTAVTSITIQPVGGLDFGTRYTLRLDSTIKDLDTDASGNPQPRSLPLRDLSFTTIKPEATIDSDGFQSRGVAIAGEYAWAIRNDPGIMNGFAVAYDLGAQTLTEVGRVYVSGQAIDISGDSESAVNGGRPAIVVGSGVKMVVPGPSNVYLFDVATPASPNLLAAVSVTEGPEDGTVLQLHLRKRFAYAVRSFPQAIQVIDLDRAKAIKDYHEAKDDLEKQMYKALVTPGVGFAQEAIVNTIRLTPPDGRHTHILDLKANEYVVKGVGRTLIYATGTLPLVIADPTVPAPLSYDAAPPTAQGLLQFGHALALARIANRDLAVVVGRGMAKQNGTGELTSGAQGLFVFDLQNPLAPNLIGSYVMSATPTDVVISKGTALVATAAGVWGFSLADPTAPRYLGLIENTGQDLAISGDGGTLVSTGPTAKAPAGGLHIASFHPSLVIKQVDPLSISVAPGRGSVNAPQEVVSTEPRLITVQVRPAMTVSEGDLSISNPRFTAPDGSSRDGVPETFPITWDNTGTGVVTLPAGRRYEDTHLRAIATAVTEAGPLTSVPSTIKLGWVKATLDSNNNTRIDERDDEAKRKGIPFAFWESDPYGWKDETDPLRGLSDYATLRLTVNKPTGVEGAPAMRLRLLHGYDSATWFLVDKKGGGLNYLQDEDVATAQRALIPAASGQDTPLCATAAGRFSVGGRECNTAGAAYLPNLTVGVHDFLIRCQQCKRRPLTTTGIADIPELVVEALHGGEWQVIDRAHADIRPVTEWTTIMSVRGAPGTGTRPVATATVPRMTDRYSTLANVYFGGPTQVPAKAKQTTVLVHGYNVSNEDAIDSFFPTYFKRLYWVGHPVHRWQGEWLQPEETPGCVKDCAHTVAITWPGNPNQQYEFPEAEFRAFQSGAPVAKYLKSLHTQRPDRQVNVVAHSLGNLVVNTALSRPDLDPIGGTFPVTRYVMNQAALPAEAFDAVYQPTAAELDYWGFPYPNIYGYSDDGPWELDWADMTALNPEQQLMRLQWNRTVEQMRSQGSLSELDPALMYTRRWRQVRPSTLPDWTASAEPQRGPWRGLFAENPKRTRMFNTWSVNDRIVGTVWRTSNYVLKPQNVAGYAARFAEHAVREMAYKKLLKAVQKHYNALPTTKLEELIINDITILPSIPRMQSRTQDDPSLQTWGLLKHTTRDEGSPLGGGSRWNAVRQYAELSYWFPATSFGAGVKSLDKVVGPQPVCGVDVCTTDFTPFSGLGEKEDALPDLGRVPIPLLVSESVASSLLALRPNGVLSHGYMTADQFPRVWDAFDEMRKMLDKKN